jgi:hypothetical protein
VKTAAKTVIVQSPGERFVNAEDKPRFKSTDESHRALPPSCGLNGTCLEDFTPESVRPDTTAVAPKHEIMKPETFDGREPIQSFLAHFDVCAKFNGWTETQKVSWLKWSLKGRAQQILWDLSSSQ